MTALYETRQQVTQAVADYDRLRMNEAQRVLLSIVDQQPALAPELAERVGGRLLGLPLLYQSLQKTPVPATSASLSEIRLLIVQGKKEDAETRLQDMFARRALSGNALLWLARLQLDRGDVPAAGKVFAAYWQQNARDRVSTYNNIVGTPSPGNEQQAPSTRARGGSEFERLLQLGMWAEGAAFAERTAVEGKDSPEYALFQALQRDAAGDVDAAIQAYQKVLAKRPANKLAQLRMDLLGR